MRDKIRKSILPNIPYLFALWFFVKLGTAYRLAAGIGFGMKLVGIIRTIGPAFGAIAPGTSGFDWLIGVAGAILLRLILYILGKGTGGTAYRTFKSLP